MLFQSKISATLSNLENAKIFTYAQKLVLEDLTPK